MGRKSSIELTPEEEMEVVNLYQEGTPMIKIAEQFQNMKHYHVDWILRKHSIPKRHNRQNSRRYDVNHDYFEIVDTEHKAYWLGFIAADGYVTKQEKVGITLNVQDKSHLETFASHIEATYPVNEYKYTGYVDGISARILMTSPKMKKDLEQYGIHENKTLILDFPTHLDPSLIRHYIRGYFDGDGSWSYNSNTRQYQFKLVGTKEILEAVLYHIGFPKQKLYRRHDNGKNTYYISIGGHHQLRTIMSYLYDDATIYLQRKYTRL